LALLKNYGIQRLYVRHAANRDDPALRNSIELLFDLALAGEGSELADPVRLSRLILDLLTRTL
jgi:HSP90 family molecular chaperone